MKEKWLKRYGLLTDFGKQANVVLKGVQKLRLRRFNAQPLSTSSFGPGSWVSENYLFWARASKYFFTLPAIQSCRQSTAAANKEVFLCERKVLQRFVVAAVACICHIMSDNRSSQGMSEIIKIYLDTMVEMDDVLLKNNTIAEAEDEQDIGEDDDQIVNNDINHDDNEHTGGDGNTAQRRISSTTTARGRRGAAEKQIRRPKVTTQKPNFVKSNSLGLMAAAEAHAYFGPAVLNWEGGFTGERKIQDVKPLLGIRRSNSEWESIVLTRLYQQETIDWMLSRHANTTTGENNTMNKQDRVIEGLFSVYRSRIAAINAIEKNEPLSAIFSKGNVWLTYRPTGRNDLETGQNARSSANLLKVCFLGRDRGQEIGGCWMEPISAGGGEDSNDIINFVSISMLETAVNQHILMLPAMKTEGNLLQFENLYYCIGDKWTERDSFGNFVSYHMH